MKMNKNLRLTVVSKLATGGRRKTAGGQTGEVAQAAAPSPPPLT